jgi:hypothetical protein
MRGLRSQEKVTTLAIGLLSRQGTMMLRRRHPKGPSILKDG